MNTTSVEQTRVPMIVVTPALPSRRSLPLEMQEALNSITQSPASAQYRNDRVKTVDGAERRPKGVAGDKGSSRGLEKGHKDEHHTHSRPPRAAKPAHLGRGYADGEASRTNELYAELQLVGREDEAGWVVIDRVTDRRKAHQRRLSNESGTTLVGDADEDPVANAAGAQQSEGGPSYNTLRRERQVEDTRRHAWYVSTPDWPKFKGVDDKPTFLERAKKATRTLSFSKKA